MTLINTLSNIFISLLSWFIGLRFHCSDIALPFPSSLTYFTSDVLSVSLISCLYVELSEHSKIKLKFSKWPLKGVCIVCSGFLHGDKVHVPMVAFGYVSISLISPNVFLLLPTASVIFLSWGT